MHRAGGGEGFGMSVPHRAGRAARLRAKGMGWASVVKEKIAPRKRAGSKFPCGTCEGAAEVVIWMGVLSWKSWTAAPQDGCDLWGGRITQEQFLGDPFIGDAPVGLGEALRNPEPVQPMFIDVRRAGDGCGMNHGMSQPVCAGRLAGRGRPPGTVRCPQRAGVTAQAVLGRFQQSCALGRQTGMGVQHPDPRRGAAPVASLGFLVSEAGQAAQMTPIGAGQVAAVEVGQLSPDLTGCRWRNGHGTHSNPGLEIAGTGLKYHTRVVSLCAHGFDDGWTGAIQIDEDVARIALFRVGVKVHVAALPVADAQKSNGGGMRQLRSRPQPLSGECPSGLGVNETDEIEVVRHGRKLPAYGLYGEIGSAVEHDPILESKGPAVQWILSGRRTVG